MTNRNSARNYKYNSLPQPALTYINERQPLDLLALTRMRRGPKLKPQLVNPGKSLVATVAKLN